MDSQFLGNDKKIIMANIIITGTSRGIGFELVQLFAQEGHNVLALSRNSQRIADLDLPNVHAFPFDFKGIRKIA